MHLANPTVCELTLKKRKKGLSALFHEIDPDAAAATVCFELDGVQRKAKWGINPTLGCFS